MKWAITDKFRHYLLGGKFKVITDNNPLTYFRSAKLGALEQRWASQLAQFDFDIQYRPGKINPADALSRVPFEPSPEPLLTVMPPEVATVNALQCEQLAVDPTPTVGVLGDTMAPVLPLDKEEEPDQTAVPEAATEVLPRLSLADLQQLQQQDPVLGPVLAAWPAKPSDTKERSMRALVQQYPRLFLKKGVLHRRQADQWRGTLEQLVLPSSLRPDVLASLHDDMGHQGYERTLVSTGPPCTEKSETTSAAVSGARWAMHQRSAPLPVICLPAVPLKSWQSTSRSLRLLVMGKKMFLFSPMFSRSSPRPYRRATRRQGQWPRCWSTSGSSATGYPRKSTVTRIGTLSLSW